MNLNLCAVLTCTDHPYITEPLLLCQEHALMVSINVTDTLYATARNRIQPSSELDLTRLGLAPITVWEQTSHPSVVYFLTNGDRVKIGTSTNVTARVGALSLRKANAALLLLGGKDLEDALHQHFAADRIGNTEWFALSVRIQNYVNRMKGSETALRQPWLAGDGPDKATIPTPRNGRTHGSETAREKVLETLKAFSSPYETTYLHKDDISTLTSLKGSTLANALTELTKAGRIHRGADRGTYGLGPDPATEAGE